MNEKYLTQLEIGLNKRKKYYNHDDPVYYGIRDVTNLFDEMDEDYYKPVRVKGAFGDNYIEYESRGEKNKSLSVREYLLMIETYLRDMINDHKAIGE